MFWIADCEAKFAMDPGLHWNKGYAGKCCREGDSFRLRPHNALDFVEVPRPEVVAVHSFCNFRD